MRGRKPEPSKHPFYAPALETAEHKEMFAYYASLGPSRSLSKVAKQFGKSVSLIGSISRAFKWRERIIQAEREMLDPIVKLTQTQVNDSRLKMVFVINDITDTLHQLAYISQQIKETSDDDPIKQYGTKIRRLGKALETYGITIKSAKDLRDLVSTLKDVLRFNEDLVASKVDGDTNNTQINVEEMTLVIKDD